MSAFLVSLAVAVAVFVVAVVVIVMASEKRHRRAWDLEQVAKREHRSQIVGRHSVDRGEE